MEALQILVKNMEKKKDIRTRILNARTQMSYEDWWEKSHCICDKVTTHPFFLNAKNIFCYIDVRNEVGTRALIEYAWALGKRVAAPRICGGEMDFCYFQSFQELTEDAFHIPSPSIESEIANTSEALIIMPGAVFDKHMHRIGYGKGYYDKYIEKHPDCKTLAVAFQFQVLDNIPFDTHDKCPEYLITEEYIYGKEFAQ